MDNKMRFGILGMLFTLMGMIVCVKSMQTMHIETLWLGSLSLFVGIYCFFRLGKQHE